MFHHHTAKKGTLEERRLKAMNVHLDGQTVIAPMWAIRHMPTQHWMPISNGIMGRGSSHWDHLIGQAIQVRLFKTKRAAKIALAAWLNGKHMPEWDEGCCYVGDVVTVEDRKAEEMEVVCLDLVPRLQEV